jgi:hypothetical protein
MTVEGWPGIHAGFVAGAGRIRVNALYPAVGCIV